MEVGQEMGWKRCESMVDLFRSSDYITCHTSAKDAWGKDNEGLLNEVLSQLGADRPKESPRIFLNLARGNLHSSDALNEAVTSGAIRRAAVDVEAVVRGTVAVAAPLEEGIREALHDFVDRKKAGAADAWY